MLPYIETIFRSTLAFAAVLIASRFIGQPVKTVTGIAVGGLAALWSLDRSLNLYHGLLAFTTWTLWSLVVAMLALKVPSLRDFINGKPTPLIDHGRILEQNLRKTRMTAHDMMALLREKDAFRVADVEFAALEGDGQLSVLLKSENQPITPKAQHMAVENQPVPRVIVADGKVIPKAIAASGMDRPWIWQQVQAKGATSWEDVYFAEVDGQGKVYVDLYDDLMQLPQAGNQAKPLVLATLKKAEADLESYALQTEDSSAKLQYAKDARLLQRVIRSVTPYLQA